ncbi:MAG: hydroxymethylglutaryl-CoA lyase [Ignavibacteria bacterium]
MEKKNNIIIHEVGPRDGLQVEVETVPTEQKIIWIEGLIASGMDIIQLGSFVNPKRVPQMADTDELFRIFSAPGTKNDKVILSGLVLNEKGLERGMTSGVDMFCMGVSASETHSMKNTGMSTGEALGRIIGMSKDVIESGKKIQVSVQSAFGCGYEGKIPESKVLDIVKKYIDAGIMNISLADTAGHANPEQVERLFSSILSINPDVQLACHFHDTYGLGIVNCYTAWKTGVTFFESSFAGLGGCPFTATASGNVCTEDLVHMFNSMDLRGDIKLDKIIDVSADAEEFFKRELPGSLLKIEKNK